MNFALFLCCPAFLGLLLKASRISMAILYMLALTYHALEIDSTEVAKKTTLDSSKHPSESSQHIWSVLCSSYGGGQTADKGAESSTIEKRSGSLEKSPPASISSRSLYSYLRKRSQPEPVSEPSLYYSQTDAPTSPRPKRNTGLANYPWDSLSNYTESAYEGDLPNQLSNQLSNVLPFASQGYGGGGGGGGGGNYGGGGGGRGYGGYGGGYGGNGNGGGGDYGGGGNYGGGGGGGGNYGNMGNYGNNQNYSNNNGNNGNNNNNNGGNGNGNNGANGANPAALGAGVPGVSPFGNAFSTNAFGRQMSNPFGMFQTNRLDMSHPMAHSLGSHGPVFVVSKSMGLSSWLIPLLILLILPFLIGAAFIPLFLKSIVYLLQIGRNLGILFPLIPPVMNGTTLGG